MKWLILTLLSGVANASPFYFETTLGGAGSPSRGFQNTTAGIAIGANLFETGPITWSAEIGYTNIGTTSGKKYMVPQQVALSSVPPSPPVVVEDPDVPFVIQVQVEPEVDHVEPPISDNCIDMMCVDDPPTVILDSPIVLPEPPKPIGPPDIGHIDDQEPTPVFIIDLPGAAVIPEVVPQSLKNANVRINGQQIKEYLPKFRTDLYSGTIGARLKLGNFIWINFRGGGEKKVIDGQIEEKTQKGQLINWRTKEKFRDDEWTYILGGSVLFELRKQLMGIVKIDYHDLNNQVDDNDFQTDDIIVSVGFRFPI